MHRSQKQLQSITSLLHQQTTLSLATTGPSGEASVAPLFYLADDDLSLYWLSSTSSEHSLNVARTPSAAATVHSNATSCRQIRGLQMFGTVSIVGEAEPRAKIIKSYAERFKLGPVFRLAIRQSTLYRFEPEFIRYIDNAKGFGCKFELTRPPEGWTLAKPVR